MDNPTAWTASDGQSGQLGPLNSGESVSFTVAPDANGTATFNIAEFSLTETIDGCVPPPPPPGCGLTTETGPSGFPVIDMNPANCGPTVTSGPWTPIEIGGAVCPDWFVYHTDQTGDWEIFRLGEIPGEPAANPNLTQGVGPRVYDVSPSRSPDSQWIAFASNRDGNWEIYVGRTDGSFQQRVTYAVEAIDIDPAWSPMGNYIVYDSARDGNWELYMVDVTTGVETRLTDNPASDLNAFWSPDGTKVVFQSDRDGFWQIYELDIATHAVTRLSDGAGDDLDPQYSNNGQTIAFRSLRDGDNGVIYVMNADGSNVHAISDPNGNAMNQAFSPDDTLIAYQSDLDGDNDIYVYEFASGQTRLITDNTIPDYAPTWFCNGPTLIFTSDITQDSNIFDTPALPISAPPINVQTQASQLTTEPQADQYPQDSPSEENASREGALPRPAKNK
jgi:Tol biopolymer transport system component